jgi:two-component system cell cycle sensor histidine kinase/response regulator CckA
VALRLAREYRGTINTLLTDVVMPGPEGPELVDRMKPLRPAMKVLFMSAYEVVHRLQPGALFLAKPFSVKELVTKLEA